MIEIVTTFLTTSIAFGILGFLAKTLIVERLKIELMKENTKYLTSLQWDSKVKEKAEKVAEYLAFARQLNDKSSSEDYERANRLSWELAMWLPDNIYIEMTKSLMSPTTNTNELTTVIGVRSFLLGKEAGSLNSENIAHHAPDIGK